MRSGRLAAAAGVKVQTLRYYERRGLLPEPPRTPGGYREYGEDAVAQRLGFTLDEVAGLLDAGRRHPTPALPDLARAKLAEIEDRMADLERIREGLQQVLRARCVSITACTCPQRPLP